MSSTKGRPATSAKKVVQPDKQALLRRLHRIEGQVRGVAKMLQEDRYCMDILTQIAALRSALDAVALRLLEEHTKGCVSQAMCHGDDTAIDELLVIIKQFVR